MVNEEIVIKTFFLIKKVLNTVPWNLKNHCVFMSVSVLKNSFIWNLFQIKPAFS